MASLFACAHISGSSRAQDAAIPKLPCAALVRRQLMFGGAAVFCGMARENAAAAAAAAAAEQGLPSYEKNEFVQKLLERSRANKERYDKERLESYYRRNFTDYFDFIQRSSKSKANPSEAEKKIDEWLQKNKK